MAADPRNGSDDQDVSEHKALPKGTARDMFDKKVFPDDWALIPVAGKDTFHKGWTDSKIERKNFLSALVSDSRYHGLGVVTGALSGGLIALDIDGHEADARYKAISGEEYLPYGKETTMAWTSGKPGRRQLLWRVPEALVPQLSHVISLILLEGGVWWSGKGRQNEDDPMNRAPKEELVLRFNRCMSVLPGSPHPDTKKRYRFLQYNEGKPAVAPEWVLDVLRSRLKPSEWLAEDDLKELESEVGRTQVPPRQLRGWFFKDEVQQKLQPRLTDLVFKHSVFDKFGWEERGGSKPQLMNGCPWHDSSSGTSFQVNAENGCWDCKSCGVGGDSLDFIHKIETNDMYASRPTGSELERYIKPIAEALGYRYPEDLLIVQKTTDVPREIISGIELLARAEKIIKEVRDPAEQFIALSDLADMTGRMRLTPTKIKELVTRHKQFTKNKEIGLLRDPDWRKDVSPEEHIIPGLIRRPSQVLLHARGGVGKTETAIALAKAIGTGSSIKIRGIEVQCRQGNVLWISSDQNKSRLDAQLSAQDITEANSGWFYFVENWKTDLPRELAEIIRKVEPVLVVIDSLSSSQDETGVKENEAEYASPLYALSVNNGDLSSDFGFPSCAILWIHHNTKDGAKFRGTDRINNAVDETWELKDLSVEQEATFGVNSRLMQIGKSRYDRSGDRMLIQRDLELNYSIEDLTPLLEREGVNRTGDISPRSLVLAAVTDSGEQGVTPKVIREFVMHRMEGAGQEAFPSRQAITKHLAAWERAGMVEKVGMTASDSGQGGRPTLLYRVPRGERPKEGGANFDVDDQNTWGDVFLRFATGLQPGGSRRGLVANLPKAEGGDLTDSGRFATTGPAQGENQGVVANLNLVPESDLPLSEGLQPPSAALPREGMAGWLAAFGGGSTDS
jgi:hypothetical protein